MIKAFIDGSCTRNPGIISGGVVFYKNLKKDIILSEKSEIFGNGTNNEAEYGALILCLKSAIYELKIDKLHVFSDSKLVVCQINGEWEVRNKNMKPLYDEAIDYITMFDEFKITHIPRQQNRRADRLAKNIVGIKKKSKKRKII